MTDASLGKPCGRATSQRHLHSGDFFLAHWNNLGHQARGPTGGAFRQAAHYHWPAI